MFPTHIQIKKHPLQGPEAWLYQDNINKAMNVAQKANIAHKHISMLSYCGAPIIFTNHKIDEEIICQEH